MTRDNLLRFWTFWPLQFLGWSACYAWTLLGSLPDLLRRPAAFRDNTVCVVLMFLASCALRPLCGRLLRSSPTLFAFEWRAAVWSLFFSAPCALATEFAWEQFHRVDWLWFAPIYMESIFVLFVWCTLYFSIKQWQQSAREKERLILAEAEARDARLRALRYQLNPHFLFNSLNAVSTLVLDGNASAATQMLAQIGDLLRTSLDSEVAVEAALSQEIQFTERYLAIEHTRLGNRLRFEIDAPAETLDALVPSMLLQPLVENAVRHGVSPLVEGGTIAIRSALHDGRLRLMVGNSGRRNAVRHQGNVNGIGLANTAERLQTLYGNNHTFSLEWPSEGGCEVTVDLPLHSRTSPQEIFLCVP